MNDTLLKQFFDREWTPQIGELLRAALDSAAPSANDRVHRFEFNLFDVTIDAVRGLVQIHDLLDPDLSGEETLSIQAFSDALQQQMRPLKDG